MKKSLVSRCFIRRPDWKSTIRSLVTLVLATSMLSASSALAQTASRTTDGVFLSRGGVITAIALAGQTVPGVGTLSRVFDGPAFNNNSTVAFANKNILGGPTTGAVFIKKLTGSLEVVAKTGDAAPVPAGGVFAAVGLPFDDLVLNNNDDLAFIAVYTQDNGATFKMGIFLKPNAGPLTAVVLNGDTLPGTGGGTICATSFNDDPISPGSNGSLDGPWMNDNQVVVFKVDGICGASANFGESTFAKRPGLPIEQVVLIGEAAPATLGGTIESVEPGHPSINNANVFAFHSGVPVEGNLDREVIFTKVLGAPPVPRIQTGDAAPRTTGTFSSLSAPAINQSGFMSFHADIAGGGAVTQGFYVSIGGLVQAVALEGDTMPGTGGKKFCTNIEEGSISDNGRVVFLNENFGTCAPAGVFATSPFLTPAAAPDGVLLPTIIPIAIEGQSAPGTNGGVFGPGSIYLNPGDINVFDEPLINSSGDVVFISAVVLPDRPQLLNISTRGVVMDGNKVLIGGFMLTGVDPKKVVVRGMGPSLNINGTPVAGRLANPTVSLMQGQTLIEKNDSWKTNEAAVTSTGLAPGNDAEAAIVRTLQPGAYTAVLSGEDATTGIGLVEVYDGDLSTFSKLENISTRGMVETGDKVMIAGVIVGAPGSQSARVIVRALGPSLTVNNVPVSGRLADPKLDLVNANGSIVRSNDDWMVSSQQADIQASGLAPTNAKESALIEVLASGNYTAIMRGVGDTSGVGLVEVYQLPFPPVPEKAQE